MSEPTYRITTEYDPANSPHFPWQARAVRLSDGEWVRTGWGATEVEAIASAQAYLAWLASGQAAGAVYFANEDGTLDETTPAPEAGTVA